MKNLLIVDDEKIILDILRSVLAREPYALHVAANLAEARRALAAIPMDLLLTDKNLPDGSGLDLIRELKQQRPLAEAILITGFPSIESAIHAIEADVFDYIPKPVRDIFEIPRKLRRAAEKQAAAEERQRLIDELQQKNDALEEALAESRALQAELIQSEKLAGIGTLAAGVAHEISSPLFGIMGLAEAIADEEEIGLAQAYAKEIVDYCRKIRDIVVELSSYSRSSAQEYLTTVELARTVQDAVRLVERTAVVGPVRYEVEVEPGLYLHARTNEIQQIFVNLVKNAAEAVWERFQAEGQAEGQAGGQARGAVRVEAARTDSGVLIRVRDNGAGIPEEKQRMVFDPFYTTKPPGKGTGLGLNIVWRIVTRYRGTIIVQSRTEGEDRGTVFELRFPVDRG